jgi:hypothetical protein
VKMVDWGAIELNWTLATAPTVHVTVRDAEGKVQLRDFVSGQMHSLPTDWPPALIPKATPTTVVWCGVWMWFGFVVVLVCTLQCCTGIMTSRHFHRRRRPRSLTPSLPSSYVMQVPRALRCVSNTYLLVGLATLTRCNPRWFVRGRRVESLGNLLSRSDSFGKQHAL